MSELSKYTGYTKYSSDVASYRQNKLKEEILRQQAFENKKLTQEELTLARKRGEVLKRNIDALDEYAHTLNEGIESVSQTILGEATGIMTSIGCGIGEIYKRSQSGRRATAGLYKKLGRLKPAAPLIIPATTGLAFAIIANFPILKKITEIDVETTRIERFFGMKNELSNYKDFAILTDEQIKEAQQRAKNVILPEVKTSERSILDSLNIFKQLEAYTDILNKRKTYNKEKSKYENALLKQRQTIQPYLFSSKDIKRAKEEKEVMQRIVNTVNLESQDYIERVFKILDVTEMCLFGFGIIGFWTLEKIMSLLKIPDGKFKNGLSFAASLAGCIFLNSKVAEYRNNTIRIARHKKFNELLKDPTNFMQTPEDKKNKNIGDINIPEEKKESIFKFISQFLKDKEDYETYLNTTMTENQKFRIAARGLKLSPEQIQDAKLRKQNFIRTATISDEYKRKFEEAYEIFVVLATAPMGLVASALGNGLGWAAHRLRNAPKEKIPLYSILGTVAGLIPAIAIELYTTIEIRKASRVAYMKAQEEIKESKDFIDYNKTANINNSFLNISFKQFLNTNKSN